MDRQSLGERLSERLLRRVGSRRRVGLSEALLARFGIADGDGAMLLDGPVYDSDAADGDMVTLSIRPYLRRMRRLALARQRREQRLSRLSERVRSHHKRAVWRRWPGAVAQRTTAASLWGGGLGVMASSDMKLPPAAPVRVVEEAAPQAAPVAAARRERGSTVRTSSSPWLSTPWTGARVARNTARGRSSDTGRSAQPSRALDRVGQRLVDAPSAHDPLVRSLQDSASVLGSSARGRRVQQELVELVELPAAQRAVRIRRIVRRAGVVARPVVQEIEAAMPEARVSASAVALDRMATPTATRARRGLRPVLSGSPAMQEVRPSIPAAAEEQVAAAPSARPRPVQAASSRAARRSGAWLSTSPVRRAAVSSATRALSASPMPRSRAATAAARARQATATATGTARQRTPSAPRRTARASGGAGGSGPRAPRAGPDDGPGSPGDGASGDDGPAPAVATPAGGTPDPVTRSSRGIRQAGPGATAAAATADGAFDAYTSVQSDAGPPVTRRATGHAFDRLVLSTQDDDLEQEAVLERVLAAPARRGSGAAVVRTARGVYVPARTLAAPAAAPAATDDDAAAPTVAATAPRTDRSPTPASRATFVQGVASTARVARSGARPTAATQTALPLRSSPSRHAATRSSVQPRAGSLLARVVHSPDRPTMGVPALAGLGPAAAPRTDGGFAASRALRSVRRADGRFVAARSLTTPDARVIAAPAGSPSADAASAATGASSGRGASAATSRTAASGTTPAGSAWMGSTSTATAPTSTAADSTGTASTRAASTRTASTRAASTRTASTATVATARAAARLDADLQAQPLLSASPSAWAAERITNHDAPAGRSLLPRAVAALRPMRVAGTPVTDGPSARTRTVGGVATPTTTLASPARASQGDAAVGDTPTGRSATPGATAPTSAWLSRRVASPVAAASDRADRTPLVGDAARRAATPAGTAPPTRELRTRHRPSPVAYARQLGLSSPDQVVISVVDLPQDAPATAAAGPSAQPSAASPRAQASAWLSDLGLSRSPASPSPLARLDARALSTATWVMDAQGAPPARFSALAARAASTASGAAPASWQWTQDGVVLSVPASASTPDADAPAASSTATPRASAWHGARIARTPAGRYVGARSATAPPPTWWAGARTSRTGSLHTVGARMAQADGPVAPRGRFDGGGVYRVPLSAQARAGGPTAAATTGAQGQVLARAEAAPSADDAAPLAMGPGLPGLPPQLATPPSSRAAGRARPTLARTLGAVEDGHDDLSLPTWARRASGEPLIHREEKFIDALARASEPEDVVRIIYERASRGGLSASGTGLPAPVIQIIEQIRSTAASIDPDAATVRAGAGSDAEVVRRAQGSSSTSAPRATARVARGFTALRNRGSASSRDGVGSDKLSKLSRRLQELILLAERQKGAAREQVRMAEDSAAARAEGQASPGSAEGGNDRKIDIEALGREVLEVVSMELEMRKQRSQEGSDEYGWW